MNAYFHIAIASATVATALVVISIVVGGALRNYFEIKRDEIRVMMQPKPIDPSDRIKYSNEVLDFVLKIVAQEAVLYFRNFTDTHTIEKVTLAQVKNIVSDVATKVNDSMKRTNIDFELVIFTQDFYNHFIVQSSMDYVKQLLAKYVIAIVEE